jgi:broad specificity phosphatase PhoE
MLRASQTTRLVIVRHGQTAANTAKLFHGWTDLPLDETGERQAALVARRIADEFEADALLSSPLKRARATATALSNRTGLDVHIRPELREIHFGDLEGYSVERLKVEHPEIAAQTLDPHNTSLRWPNGDDIHQFYLRTAESFSAIAEEHRFKTVIVVAHGGVIGGYLRLVTGQPLNDWQAFGLRNCGISLVEISDGNHRVLVANDCVHLDAELAMAEELN